MLLSSWDLLPFLRWIEPRAQKKRQEGQTCSISMCSLPPTIQGPIAQCRKDVSVPKNIWAKPPPKNKKAPRSQGSLVLMIYPAPFPSHLQWEERTSPFKTEAESLGGIQGFKCLFLVRLLILSVLIVNSFTVRLRRRSAPDGMASGRVRISPQPGPMGWSRALSPRLRAALQVDPFPPPGHNALEDLTRSAPRDRSISTT
jgi:hypothetical protein